MTDTYPEGERKLPIEIDPWDGEQAPPAGLSKSQGHKDLPEACAHTVEAARHFGKADSTIAPEELERLTAGIIGALKTVYDPEIPVDIYELGLIYKIDIDDERNVHIEMSLTAPGCPVAGEMPGWVENAVGAVPGVNEVRVKLVFNPPWDPSRMSEEAQIALNMF